MKKNVFVFIICSFIFLLISVPLMAINTPYKVSPVIKNVVFDIPMTMQIQTQAQRYDTAPIVVTKEKPTMVLPSLASKWVKGERIELTENEVLDFEKGLYATKTKEEYEKYLENSNLAHYNKGIDLSVFEWNWDEMKTMYADHRVEKTRATKAQSRIAPNVIGMKAQDAFDLIDKMGCLVAFSYSYSPDSNLPVGYCYRQDPESGDSFTTHSGMRLMIQAPIEISCEPVTWDPDDKNFDIYKIAKDIRENSFFSIIVPNVVGLPYEDAKRKLEDLGFSNIVFDFVKHSEHIKPGFCYEQNFKPGTYLNSNGLFYVYVQRFLPKHIDFVPDLTGLTTVEIEALFEGTGLNIYCSMTDHPFPGFDTMYCFDQELVRGSDYEGDILRTYMRHIPNIYGLSDVEINELLKVTGVKIFFQYIDEPEAGFEIPHCFYYNDYNENNKRIIKCFMSYLPHEMIMH